MLPARGSDVHMLLLQRVSMQRSMWWQQKQRVLVGCLFRTVTVLVFAPVLWSSQQCQLCPKWPSMCASNTCNTVPVFSLQSHGL
jgi:hypothetical protein